jgi:hypothetical protein
VESATDALEGGGFSFNFFFPSEACNLGAGITGGGALYIDVDGDGECNPAEDEIFVWTASGGPPGTNFLVPLSPNSGRCQVLHYGAAAQALAAAQQLCPRVGDCLSFCGAPPSFADVSDVAAFCPADGDAGAADAEPEDGGQRDAAPDATE